MRATGDTLRVLLSTAHMFGGVYTDLRNYIPYTQETMVSDGSFGVKKIARLDQTATVYLSVGAERQDEPTGTGSPIPQIETSHRKIAN